MGIFSRKKSSSGKPARPTNSKDIHDSFARYVAEAKFVGLIHGLDFSQLDPYQKVFAFLQEDPACIALIVTVGDGIYYIQCLENEPKITEIPFSEILEAEIIEGYESDLLHSDDPDSDNSEVHHLRTPRLAMSLATKEFRSVLVAHDDQMQFVAGYLYARKNPGIFDGLSAQ